MCGRLFPQQPVEVAGRAHGAARAGRRRLPLGGRAAAAARHAQPQGHRVQVSSPAASRRRSRPHLPPPCSCVRGVCRSAERTCALQLCGWGWGWENAGVGVERAEAEGTPCRAAALAAFHLRTRAALDVLARAQEPRLRVAALGTHIQY